jgi:hypothetical protein
MKTMTVTIRTLNNYDANGFLQVGQGRESQLLTWCRYAKGTAYRLILPDPRVAAYKKHGDSTTKVMSTECYCP